MIETNTQLAQLMQKNKIYPSNISNKDMQDKINYFIESANNLIEEEKLNLNKFNINDLYFKWEGDEYWLSCYPYLVDDTQDKSKDFEYLIDMCWQENEGGDGLALNEYGLGGWGMQDIEELNLLDNSVQDNIKVILDKDLSSIFGLTKDDLI